MTTIDTFQEMDEKAQVTLTGFETCWIGTAILNACEYILNAENDDSINNSISPENWRLICELRNAAHTLNKRYAEAMKG